MLWIAGLANGFRGLILIRGYPISEAAHYLSVQYQDFNLQAMLVSLDSMLGIAAHRDV